MWPRKLLWVSLSGSSESESLPEVGGEGSGHRGSSFSAWMSAPGGGREMGVHVKDYRVGAMGATPFPLPSPVHMPTKVRLTSL